MSNNKPLANPLPLCPSTLQLCWFFFPPSVTKTPDITAAGKESLISVQGFRGLGSWLFSLAFSYGWSMW